MCDVRNMSYVTKQSIGFVCHSLFIPFMTSGTYMPHLQRAFSSPLGQQYPTFSPCCHLPSSISVPLNQSECIFPRNGRVQMILWAMLHSSIAHIIMECKCNLSRYFYVLLAGVLTVYKLYAVYTCMGFMFGLL